MNPKHSVFVFCLLLIASLCQQASSQELVSKSVLASGGAALGDSSYRIVGTLGQPFIGVVETSGRINHVGFWYVPVGKMTTAVDEATGALPKEFRLEQNYPNPFNPVTTIQFALPERSQVTLKLFDILGRTVATLVDDELEPGVHKVLFEATGLASGVYVYRIQSESTNKTGGFVRAKKFLLLK